MIILTGAAGFIGSCVATHLHRTTQIPLLLADDFSRADKAPNLRMLNTHQQVHRDALPEALTQHATAITAVIHIGARTDTTEFDDAVFQKLNIRYSQMLWKWCAEHQVPLIYASSAATYGLGELGYEDNEALIPQLKPLNPYGESKNEFDKWALLQPQAPPFWAGLKFFNVYGPNEYHKGRMASVIFHAFRQIKETGSMRLFRSHRPDYTDGGQKRDFVYVKDVISVIEFLLHARTQSGIYNLGSGTARTFLDLANNTFAAMGRTPDISFIDTPEDIRDKYQYFTEADMRKLYLAGYSKPFHSLEEGIADYITHYLIPNAYYS